MITMDTALAFAESFVAEEERLHRLLLADEATGAAFWPEYRAFKARFFAPGLGGPFDSPVLGGDPEVRRGLAERIQRRPLFRIELLRSKEHGEVVAITAGDDRKNDFGPTQGYRRQFFAAPGEDGALRVISISWSCSPCGVTGRGRDGHPCRECKGKGWSHATKSNRRGVTIGATNRLEDRKLEAPTDKRSLEVWSRPD